MSKEGRKVPRHRTDLFVLSERNIDCALPRHFLLRFAFLLVSEIPLHENHFLTAIQIARYFFL